MDALLKHFEAAGWSITFQEGWKSTLELIVDEGVDIPQKCWSDSKRHRLEDCLGEFVTAMIQAGKAWKERRQQWEAEALLRAQAQKRREEELQRQAEELERRAALEKAAADHCRAAQLRSFIRAVEEQSPADPVVLTKWVTWAEEHAKRIDPLKNGLLPKLINAIP